jgi:hypothetical protein
MHRLVILAAVVVLAASSVNCSRERANSASDIFSSPSVLAPSTTHAAATRLATEGKGGHKDPAGGSSSSSLTLVTYADINGNGLPDWGDTVTFKVSTTETTEPHVDLACSQNGVVVYWATTGYFDGYLWPWTQFMTLSSTAWQGGAAECTAELYYFSGRRSPVIASISFTAGK